MKLFITTLALIIFVATPAAFAEGIIGPTERLQEIQQRRDVKFSEEQKPLVVAQCVQGKSQIVAIQASADSAIRKRLAIYETIQKEIKAIELRMTKQGADASEVDLLIGKMQQDLDSFTEQARYSQQLAEDIATIDCNTVPELYRAAADEYIDSRNKLYETATDLKRIIVVAPDETFNRLMDRLKI